MTHMQRAARIAFLNMKRADLSSRILEGHINASLWAASKGKMLHRDAEQQIRDAKTNSSN